MVAISLCNICYCGLQFSTARILTLHDLNFLNSVPSDSYCLFSVELCFTCACSVYLGIGMNYIVLANITKLQYLAKQVTYQNLHESDNSLFCPSFHPIFVKLFLGSIANSNTFEMIKTGVDTAET